MHSRLHTTTQLLTKPAIEMVAVQKWNGFFVFASESSHSISLTFVAATPELSQPHSETRL